MDREDTTMTPTLTRKTSILPVGAGTLLPSPTTRSPSFSRPDGRESTTGNWPVLQSAAPPVVKVSHHASTWILHIINTERKKEQFSWFIPEIKYLVSVPSRVQILDLSLRVPAEPRPGVGRFVWQQQQTDSSGRGLQPAALSSLVRDHTPSVSTSFSSREKVKYTVFSHVGCYWQIMNKVFSFHHVLIDQHL